MEATSISFFFFFFFNLGATKSQAENHGFKLTFQSVSLPGKTGEKRCFLGGCYKE